MRILIINGNTENAERLGSELESHYVVDIAFSGEEGVCLSQINEYDALIIDSYLPDIKAHEACSKARDNEVVSPILMLLDDGSGIEEKVTSLECGADVILTKPVHFQELFAYVRSMVRKPYKVKYSSFIKANELVLNIYTREVKWKDIPIVLTRKEFEVLEFLMINKGHVITKEKLLEHSWEDGLDICSNTLEVHIKSLRDKIDRKFNSTLIKTVYGFGYKISE